MLTFDMMSGRRCISGAMDFQPITIKIAGMTGDEAGEAGD
jgi:hypothetical protein